MNKDKVHEVYKAWNDTGPNIRYHLDMKAKVRREWPTLGRALDNLPPYTGEKDVD